MDDVSIRPLDRSYHRIDYFWYWVSIFLFFLQFDRGVQCIMLERKWRPTRAVPAYHHASIFISTPHPFGNVSCSSAAAFLPFPFPPTPQTAAHDARRTCDHQRNNTCKSTVANRPHRTGRSLSSAGFSPSWSTHTLCMQPARWPLIASPAVASVVSASHPIAPDISCG